MDDVPSLSTDVAIDGAQIILDIIEKGYIVGASRNQLVAYLAVNLQMVYNQGAADETARFASRLREVR